MIRTPEWVRGYFDGEGCVHFDAEPTPYGRNAQLAVETTDFDLMADLQETLASWGIDCPVKTRPPAAKANLPKARISIKSRRAIEIFFSKTRPLSKKHERRLSLLLLHWENRGRHQAALSAALAYKAQGLTRREAAQKAGVSMSQLDNRGQYMTRRLRISAGAPPPWAKVVDSLDALDVRAPRRRPRAAGGLDGD